ncbi:glucose inhibited division protein a [Holotrichia oblita]|nr:glucose inhibited division protein a [Holotrichia oblita]
MEMQSKNYDVIVIGAGHAGCEAAFAASRLGSRVLLITINLDSIAYLACNPSIGGTAKGHLVCEIDALGGLMGIIADKTAIQIRMLNVAKGSAVFSLRAQSDKIKYHSTMKQTLENIENISILQAEVSEILTSNNAVNGIALTTGEKIVCKSVVIATGVYLDSKILIGSHVVNSGPSGFANSRHLTASLKRLGLEIRRFKTGTPPRVNSRTVAFEKTTPQPGDDSIQTFSFLTKKPIKNKVMCHLTYTNPETHKIISDNIHKSAMYSGNIVGTGARYCPSIEDKIVRFPDRDRHQVFLEPESLSTNEIYLQGISTSLPTDIQEKLVQSIQGLENAQIMRSAYAIEYDCINSLQLAPTLEYKNCQGLYFAGQINGTSGYEEAAAQGLVAGINAAGKKLILSRTNSYIGVLIDDLVTVGTDEPYRMFTSRAEHRLYLRQDNADARLTPIGRRIGLVDNKRWRTFQSKMKHLDSLRKSITKKQEQEIKQGTLTSLKGDINNTVLTEIKYAGYLAREQSKIAEAKRCEASALPSDFDYTQIKALRRESQIKLNQIKPQNISQAARISGVTPADINVLLVYFKKNPKN